MNRSHHQTRTIKMNFQSFCLNSELWIWIWKLKLKVVETCQATSSHINFRWSRLQLWTSALVKFLEQNSQVLWTWASTPWPEPSEKTGTGGNCGTAFGSTIGDSPTFNSKSIWSLSAMNQKHPPRPREDDSGTGLTRVGDCDPLPLMVKMQTQNTNRVWSMSAVKRTCDLWVANCETMSMSVCSLCTYPTRAVLTTTTT